ncbi:probable basic-leucine zipper transcription factor N isoform X2 [Contarinia nasturtii]|uniref:probable basic-leucine zipper transcription factor N isoform X2 n=1 Tax=Contarinia nasturtii TaxID=265458 RepID=UPI0012D4BEAD|nr:probable basic-leucine zipper transcription factor N isoform X2 [Contarinia nasturtii]
MARSIMAAVAAVATTTTSCSCTKISIMHLFHEMKQKFPTVPDNVVCEFVSQNCHDRLACIDGLEDYPNSANVYPAALRNQPIKKKASNCNQQRQTIGLSILANTVAKENAIPNIAKSVQVNIPNTLNSNNLNCCTQPVNRPTRQAPPPPTTSSPHQQQKSTPNLHQPNLNLSVNVIVSGSARQTKPQQPLSHCSFTLHQPNNNNSNSDKNKKTKITSTTHTNSNMPTRTTETDNNVDIPSLRYTSNSYDADIGYQSRLEITVAGTNSRLSNENNEQHMKNTGNCISLRRTCETTSTGKERYFPNLIGSSEFIRETKIVHHQILCKQKLVLELEKDRKRLERMQRELLAIQAPLPHGGLTALNFEIEELQKNCRLLAQQVEESGPYALGETNEAFYRNIHTGQQQQRQPLRPHRPAPPPHSQPIIETNIAGAGNARFNSLTPTTQSAFNPIPVNEDADWICNLCTFQNKYTQQTCEACTMPFLSAGNHQNLPMYSLPSHNNNSNTINNNLHNNNNDNNNNMLQLYNQPSSLPTHTFSTIPTLSDS